MVVSCWCNRMLCPLQRDVCITHGVRGAAAVLCRQIGALQRLLAGALPRGTRPGHTLITFALNTSPGFPCSIVCFGLPLRTAGSLVGLTLWPLAECGCLRRWGSDSLLVNGGRGILALRRLHAPPQWLCDASNRKVLARSL